MSWQPAATLEVIRLRAGLLREIREYFAGQGVLEVETPVLSCATVTDRHIHSLATRLGTPPHTFYLQTSPEYPMKRLLCAGAKDIYQICKVFRDEVPGRWHNPEFTMVEWYRLGVDHHALMADVEGLLHRLLRDSPGDGVSEKLSFREAVQRSAGIDPLAADAAAIRTCLAQHGIEAPPTSGDPSGIWLDLLVATVVAPQLGRDGLTFVYDYPANQAALARLRPGNPPLAERFEVFCRGLELANGFRELASPGEHR